MPREAQPTDIKAEIEKLKNNLDSDFDPYALTIIDPAEEGWSRVDVLRAFAKARQVRTLRSHNKDHEQ